MGWWWLVGSAYAILAEDYASHLWLTWGYLCRPTWSAGWVVLTTAGLVFFLAIWLKADDSTATAGAYFSLLTASRL